MNNIVNKDHELFSNQYFVVADIIRSNCAKEQFSLYALSKLKFSKHYWYFKYLLMLSGYKNLHPGPVSTYALCVLNRSGKDQSRVKCGLWLHKKCNKSENSHLSSLLMCTPCTNKTNDYLVNIWHHFPFGDDFFQDREHVPS